MGGVICTWPLLLGVALLNSGSYHILYRKNEFQAFRIWQKNTMYPSYP